MDFGRVALVGAGADGVLVFAGQVGVVAVAVEEVGYLLDDGGDVEAFLAADACHRATGDVAHGVALAARGGQPRGFDGSEDVGQVVESRPVELDALAGGEFRVVTAVAHRNLAHRAQLLGPQLAARHLDAHHEGSHLGLVMGQSPPVQANDVLLGDVLIPLADHVRQFLQDVVWVFLVFQPFHVVALVDEFPRRVGHTAKALGNGEFGVGCHWLPPIGIRLGVLRCRRGPSPVWVCV